ncbi:MAG: anhydro-N-acetylmuramic acid kinase [Cyanobacteriota bacterium]
MKIVGLMSGTSVDGIDAALVETTGETDDLNIALLAAETYSYPPQLREEILAVCAGKALSMAELATLDDAIAFEFAQAAQKIQSAHSQADLIGSHGQTVFHRPKQGNSHSDVPLAYSLQLGRGEAIACLTGLPTVSNFRQADIAAGGEGAPLVPKVDAYLFSSPTQTRCIQNLGGIGNVTYLPSRQTINWEKSVYGWDTGPGNVLIDLAVQWLTEGRQTYDQDGDWASQGTPCLPLVNQWLKQDFFSQPPPKSTGRELFGEVYLRQRWQEAKADQLSPADWLATVTELTVASIVESYRRFLPCLPDEVLICGGGSRNQYLKQRLQTQLDIPVLTTDEVGVSGSFKEAIAFAVLAHWRYNHSFPGNLPSVTGAKQPMLLGEIHLPVSESSPLQTL